MPKLSTTIVLSCCSLALTLASAAWGGADAPGHRDAPRLSDTPEAEPVEVPQTTQAWYDRMHKLTREMTPEEVLAIVGREPDLIEPRSNGRTRWTYFYQNPGRPDHTNRLWIFFHEGKFYSW